MERTTWRAFVAAARAWKAEPTRAHADALARWARVARKTPVPGALDDRAWYLAAGKAVQAGLALRDAAADRRAFLFAQIEPVLERLADAAGEPQLIGAAIPPGTIPSQIPYYLRD
jgi:hypothetical protein